MKNLGSARCIDIMVHVDLFARARHPVPASSQAHAEYDIKYDEISMTSASCGAQIEHASFESTERRVSGPASVLAPKAR